MNNFIFVGNRKFVLQEMLKNNLTLSNIIVIKDSHLYFDIKHDLIPEIQNYSVIKNKSELLHLLKNTKFNVLVSNGCPFILPIKQLPKAQYVNIHPSCLPDLRGVDPVIGSVLHARDSGATCHIMDAGIDTGEIISQVRIPYTDDLDVTTLYQLSFFAEQKAFTLALKQKFKPINSQQESDTSIYYSRRTKDWNISFNETNDEILRKVKAFNNLSIGCRFKVDNRYFHVFSGQKMYNPFLSDIVKKFPPGIVALSYENNIIFHKDDEIIRFSNIIADNSGPPISKGSRLFES